MADKIDLTQELPPAKRVKKEEEEKEEEEPDWDIDDYEETAHFIQRVIQYNELEFCAGKITKEEGRKEILRMVACAYNNLIKGKDVVKYCEFLEVSKYTIFEDN